MKEHPRKAEQKPPLQRKRDASLWSGSTVTDQRPVALAQRRVQSFINQSSKSQNFVQLQSMVSQSSQCVAQRKQIERIMGPAVQLQEEPVQRQKDPEEEELLQGRFEGGRGPVQRKGENQTGMPDQLKGGLEQLSGADLSGVRVKYNSGKPAKLNALAYAQGSDIHIGPGQEKHLPHEGWHAVQQMQGRVKPTIQAAGVPINDDGGLEREADVMGAKALQAKLPDEAKS